MNAPNSSPLRGVVWLRGGYLPKEKQSVCFFAPTAICIARYFTYFPKVSTFLTTTVKYTDWAQKYQGKFITFAEGRSLYRLMESTEQSFCK
jgi:hypothetical protein